jgi:hypothetical protein
MRPHRIDTTIFERARTHEEARRAHKLEHMYHAGQDKIWNGREVLEALIAKHGGRVSMSVEQKRALARIFSGLMWGELAAWKISAQLADQLVDVEAKMAATAQVHDEARHFYVLHDYLERLDIEIPDLDYATRMMLESVLATSSLAEKLVGMQLFVETMALTVFKMVRELGVDPVLSELLLYYERDEARHVGLGVQYAPLLVRPLKSTELAHLSAFQAKVLLASLFSLKRMEPSLRLLGVSPRKLADCGEAMCIRTLEDLARVNGGPVMAVAGPSVRRSFRAAKELMFPVQPVGVLGRVLHAGRALLNEPS